MTDNHIRQTTPSFWSTASKLSPEVFEAWQKPDQAISPVAIVATVDPDGFPRAIPFGSLRAITPRLLRLCSFHGHETFVNLCRDGRVTIVMVSPPAAAVSVRGRAHIVKSQMEHDKDFAIVDIDIEEVKNDMAYRIVIDSGINIHAKESFKIWYEAAMSELEELGE